MSEQQKTPHASRDALMQYALGLLSGREMANLEQHIAACDTCADRSVAMHRLAGVFDDLPARIVPSEARNPVGIAERIWAALSGAKETVEGLLGVVGLETGGEVPSLSASEYATLVPRESPFSGLAVLADSQIRVRGAIRTRGSTKQGQPPAKGGPKAVKAEAGGLGGMPKWTVIAWGEEGEVIALLERWTTRSALPVCMIMPARPGTPFIPQVVEWVEEESGLRAQRDVPRGTYIVALVGREPSEMRQR